MIGSWVFRAGRALQIAGLALTPSALWAGAVEHSERGAIVLFLGGIFLFYSGYFLTRWGSRI